MLLTVGLATPVAFAQPVTNSDNFPGIEIAGVWGSVTNDLTGATFEPGEPNHAGYPAFSTVWYHWFAPQDGEVFLDTLGNATDTLLAVYAGNGILPQLSALRQVAANDDLFPFRQTTISGLNVYTQPYNGPSGLRFNAKAGTTYYIAVAAKFFGGPVNLSWAYHSSGIFRFATEDAVTSIVQDTNTTPPSFQLVTTPVFKAAESESLPDDGSTYETYYQFGVPGTLVTVTRMGGYSGRMLVDYFTEDITTPLPGDMPAVAGADYFPVQGTLVFDDFEMTKRIVIPIESDFSQPQSNRNFAIVLTNARPDIAETPDVSPPRIDGVYGRAIVKILDVDIDPIMARNFQIDTNISEEPFFAGPTNAVFNFSRVAYRTPEDVNGYYQLRIWVYRGGTNNESVTVHYRVNNQLGAGDNADPAELDNNLFPLQPGSDYATPTPADDADGNNPIGIHGTDPDFEMAPNYGFPGGGTLDFGQNIAGRAILINVTNDNRTEFNEDFHIFLYRTRNNATELVGTVNEANLTILYDDQDTPAGSVDQNHNADYGVSMVPPVITTPPNMAHPGADSVVYAMAVQPDDKTVICGDFLNYNATTRGRIARMNLNGSLDTSFNPGSGANDFIGAIARTSTGQFVIGGGFTAFNGNPRIRVARLNANGSLDATFSPGLGPDGNVWALVAQPDGKVIIAGEFSTVGGSARARVARLNTDGSLDATFDPGVNGPNATVWALALQSDGKVLIGGEFTSVGGSAIAGVARLNADGSLDSAFTPGAGTDGTVYALAVQTDGKVLVGGQFNSLDFNSRNGLARLNGDGSIDPTFDTASSGVGVGGVVYSILPTGAGIYIGGTFDTFNGTHRRSLVRLYPNGTVDTGFLDTAYNQFAGLHRARFSDAKGVLYALGVQSDGNVMIAGSFDKVGGGQADIQIRPDTADPNLWTEPKARDGIRNRSNVARLIGGITPGPGNIKLTAPELTAQENQSSLSVSLTRENGSLGYLSANFEIESGLAQAGVDYVYNAVPPIYLSSWNLAFPASEPGATTRMHSDGLLGDNFVPQDIYGRSWYNYSPGTLVVTINNDFSSQGDRNTTVRLANPTAADQFFLGGENIPLGGALGFSQAPLTIYDDDHQNGVIGFASANFVVNENVTNATVTVIRTNGSYGSVTIQYATVTGGSATAGLDYQIRSGTLVFANGQTNKSFTIPITDDSTVEPDETISVRLSGVTGGATIGLTNAIVTIVDNDTPGGKLNFAVSNFSTNESAGSAIITVNRSGSSVGTLTVYAIATNGTATAGADFVGVTNLLSWSNGDVTPKTFIVPLLDDVVVEPDETVTLRLISPTLNGTTNLASLGPVTNATLTILNDDFRGAVQYSTSTYSANENGGAAIITVVRPGGSAESVNVNFAAVGASAVAGVDFTPTNGTLSFGPGEVSKSFAVTILNNGVPDLSRFIALSLSNPSPFATNLGSPSSAIINIVDDESVNEPPGGSDTVFTPPGMNDSVLSLALQADGKIIAAGDFTTVNQVPAVRLARLQSLNGAVDSTFAASANAAVQSVAVQADERILIAGSFTTVDGVVRNRIARLQSNGALDTSFNPGSGTDNPVLAVAPAFVGGTIKAVICGNFASVNGAVRNGVARLNNDGTVDAGFDPGTGADGVVYGVAVYPTNSTHAGKMLICGGFSSINGTARNGIARLNNDGSLDLNFNPGTGAAGEVRAVALQIDGRILIGGSFTNFNGTALNRLARLNDNGSVDNTFNPGVGADDTVLSIAVQGDTKIVVAGLFTHCNGVTRNRITRLNNDGSADPTINFGAGANNFVASTVVQPDGKILIGGGFTEYDGIPRQRIARIYGGSVAGSGTLEFTAANYQVAENGTNAVLTVRRRGGTAGLTAGGSITVDSIASDGTAVSGVNYVGGTTTLTFPEGEVFQNVIVPLIDDADANADRTVNFQLANILPVGSAAIGNQPTAVLTIINDDSAISFSAPTYTRIENAVDGQATISIIRTGATAGTATVDFTTTTNGTATVGVDYLGTTNLVTFAPGEIVKTVTVPILNDTLIEGNETVGLALTNVSGAFLLAPDTATLTIIDDDMGPGQIGFAFPAYSAGENTGAAAISLIRSNGYSGVVSVKVSTSDVTASAGLDYTAQNLTTVTFGDGETNKTLLIPILDDAFVEGNEVFNVTLVSTTGGATILGTNTAPVTILDNDMGFSFSSPIYVAPESSPAVTITVLRLGGTNGAASVRYSTTNIVATAGNDFTGITNALLSFASGETLKTFTVPITSDNLVEGDETFGVVLSNPSSGVQLLTSLATVTIIDDDTGFTLSTNAYFVDEGATNLMVTVYRTNATTGPASVSLTSTNGSAIAGQDFTAVGGSLNFTNGEAVKVVLIPIVNDLLVEGDEDFQLTLSGPSPGAQLVGISNAVATIIDNDAGLRFSSPAYSVNEAGVFATITVLRQNITNSTVSVSYNANNGTATAGSDYFATNGVLTFTNGEVSKTFNVQIIDDTVEEGPETVLLSLFNPVGQAGLLDAGIATLTIVDNDGGSILNAGSLLTAESGVVNGAIDPGETVSLLIAMRNVSGVDTTNLVATLLTTNGITAPSAAQNYGALINNGASVSRPFTFTANGTNGATVSATFQVQEQTGGTSYGRVTFTYVLGTSTTVFSNTALITIVDNAVASPYPSSITVTGLVGTVSKVSLLVSNLYHPSPEDIDMLLAGPTGTNTMLMSDCGGGNFITNVSLTFDDAAVNSLPDSTLISSGTYKPTNFLIADLLPDPAPSPSAEPNAPYGKLLAAFNGTNPNGLWSLYLVDDLTIFSGSINRGWQLTITTLGTIPSATDLSVKLASSASSVVQGSNITYTINVTNHGPWAATGVKLTNAIPAGTTFASATPSVGSISTNSGAVVWSVGSLAKDAGAVANIVFTTSTAGTVQLITSVSGTESDPNLDNNSATNTTIVLPPTADLAIGMVDSPDPLYIGAGNTLTYTITVTNLGPATANTVTVTNTLPPGVTFLSASPLVYTVAGNVVTFTNLGNLAFGGVPLTATITVRLTSPATLTNTAVCGAGVTDLVKGNNSISVKTIVDFPAANVAISGNGLVVSWPADANGYVLETATNLAPPVIWTQVTVPAPVTVGGMKYVTNSIGAGSQFFRLRAVGP